MSGNIHGNAFAIEDAISASVALTDLHGAVIVLSSTSGLCKDAAANAVHPNQKAVIITLFDINGTTLNTPTAPGTYTIFQGSGAPPAKAAAWVASVNDATCSEIDASGATATTGTVTLSDINGNAFSGSYDVVLDSGDHVTGSFDPEACPDLQTALNSDASSTCI
ncbi:MAG TPA: hypothetical protein VFK02_29740 [Kofleriaceae bacterium]|nr:hypothetical protein [Kofleriaceae bacterium]